MIVNDRDSRRLVIKSNQTFWVIGIFVIFMAVLFTGFFLSLNPFEELNTFMDYFGIVFFGIWLLTLLAGGVYSVVTNSKTVTLDARGILCRSLVGQDFVLWSEVADWGLSYCGQTKGEGNTYELYFSKHPCLTKNDCRKRLKGKMISERTRNTIKMVTGIIGMLCFLAILVGLIMLLQDGAMTKAAGKYTVLIALTLLLLPMAVGGIVWVIRRCLKREDAS